MNKLKLLRVIIALVFFIGLTLFFVDFTGKVPNEAHFLAHLQWVPAVLTGSLIVLPLAFLTVFFGRFFCSAICPLGILQDILIRFASLFGKKKKRYEYCPPSNIVRYSIFALTVLSYLFAGSALLKWLDPYSNFGRIASNIFHTKILFLNNLVADYLNARGNYALYNVEITTLTTLSMASALIAFSILVALTCRNGRLYCNTICPVGTFLGLFSRISFFRVTLSSECNSCGACSTKCKSQCIDSKNRIVDLSRCVNCFNCMNTCKRDGVKYSFANPFSVKNKPMPDSKPMNESRRKIMSGVGVSLLISGLAKASEHINPKSTDTMATRKPIMPPGAVNRENYDSKCTGCQLCITKCPSHVLKPAITEYGIMGMLQPLMSFKDGYCNYNCTACLDICPTGALKKMNIEDKRICKAGEAVFRKNLCVVSTDETDCGACAEHCPTQAITMVDYKDEGLTIPQLNPEYCIGCGGCESICPVRPYQAIYVEGLVKQTKASKTVVKEEADEKVEDFGF